MANIEDEKDKETRLGPDEPTTPLGTPEPSQSATAPYLSDRALRDISQRFDLLNELGRGGMGIVYRARDRETSEPSIYKPSSPRLTGE